MSTSATWEAITRSSEAVGSSASNSRPPVERARASATRCASPPDNSGIQRSANCRTPTPASARSARRRASSPRTPLKREGSSTFSRTVNSSSNCGSWKTFPIISRRTLARSPSVARVTSMPATTIDPHDGRARPATHARSEDFPEPLGPTIATDCPSSTENDTPEKRLVAPNETPTPCSSRITPEALISPVPSPSPAGAIREPRVHEQGAGCRTRLCGAGHHRRLLHAQVEAYVAADRVGCERAHNYKIPLPDTHTRGTRRAVSTSGHPHSLQRRK